MIQFSMLSILCLKTSFKEEKKEAEAIISTVVFCRDSR